MRPTSKASHLALFLALFSTTAYAEQYQVLHRIVVPSHPDATTFSKRGTIDIPVSGRGTYQAALEVASAGESNLRTSEIKQTGLDGLLYQVTVVIPNQEPATWPVAVSKACHLVSSPTDTLTVHVSPHTNLPFSISHFPASAPKDGSCPDAAAYYATTEDLAALDWETRNTSVKVKVPEKQVGPTLGPGASTYDPVTNSQRPANQPPLRPGEKPPAPPKTFVQKYWMYGVGLLVLVMFMSPEPPSEKGKK